MKTKYTYKEIWIISYPILISLVMEQMIGMTDTAFLGRVGEIELGVNPEKRNVPLYKNDAFQKVQKRRVPEKR